MKYTKFLGYMQSRVCGEEVALLQYESKDGIPYCDCTRCGKPIVRKMIVVQSKETGIELMYLGSECIKRFT